MAKRPKHLRKKPRPHIDSPDPQTTRNSKEISKKVSRKGNTMIGPPIIKRFASFLTDLQEGKVTWKTTLPIVLFLLAMLGAIIFFYKAF